MPAVVRFLNPTANKALHLGHLRNAVIGNALWGRLVARGVPAVRHVLVEDVGIFMAEACLAHAASTPCPRAAAKPDQIIGNAYAQFRRGNIVEATLLERAAELGVEPDPSRFAAQMVDRASREWKLAQQVRDLVIAGQQQTLGRLGVGFDAVDFESDELPFVEHVLSALASTACMRPTPEGDPQLLLGTGRCVSLYDAPSVPSENSILLAHVARHAFGLKGTVFLPVAGHDWADQLSGYGEVLGKAFPGQDFSNYHPLFSGMVTLAGRKMSSRTAHATLIDVAHEHINRSVCQILGDPGSDRMLDWLGSIVLKSPFLAAAPDAALEIALANFADPTSNHGWLLARAIADLLRRGLAPDLSAPSRTSVLSLDPVSVQDLAHPGLIDFRCDFAALTAEASDILLGNPGGSSKQASAFIHGVRSLGLGPPTEKQTAWPEHGLATVLGCGRCGLPPRPP